ncbi:DMT family transporter [[Brevibacterium] frigoritolerans]|uniref:DMT family transporter n=1 Tax=Peribacillus frigoritolerans TaxID=450367 RepID=A0A941FR43_9BACI|nr:DMT family transporter [Peribacillus frigoritolerans]
MQLLKYSIMVLIGSISYGTLSTMMKFGFMDGHSSGELVGSQYLVGWLIVSVIFLFSFKYKVSWKSAGLLLITGMMSTFVGKAYAVSVSELPASIAVVFLFQFTWIGVLIESFLNKDARIKINSLPFSFFSSVHYWQGNLRSASIWPKPKRRIVRTIVCIAFCAVYVLQLSIRCWGIFHETAVFHCNGGMLTAVFTTNPVTLVTNLVQTNLWYYGLLLGTLGVLVPFFFLCCQFTESGVGLGTILCAAELPSAMVVSVIFLNEQVTSLQWFGMCLIIVGIALPGDKASAAFSSWKKRCMKKDFITCMHKFVSE